MNISRRVLAETLDGGQAFRWTAQPDGSWSGGWGNHVARVGLGDNGELEIEGNPAAWADYFGGNDCDPEDLPWRSDGHLRRCVEAFPGLRILRQPFGETLLGFLCSATKQIVQIKQMMALLAERCGQPVTPTWKRLPTWEEIAVTPEEVLRGCQLGFRARYIRQTALFLAANPGWLEQTETLPYPVAKERLCSLPGVGEKVADCVLLFGAGKLEAFPVDTWIVKAMTRHYGLEGWKPTQVAHFGRMHFGAKAGLAQQYLFAWERARV